MSRSIRLEQVHIPEPCSADWSTMAGDERTRFCEACGKHVHDLSARSRVEAEAIVNASGGKLCVQMTLDYQGRPITRDGWRAWLVARWVWPAASAAVALTLAMIGCRKQRGVVAGGISAYPGSMQVRTAGTPSVQVMGDVDPTCATQPETQPSTQPSMVLGEIEPTTMPATAPTTRPANAPAAAPTRDPWTTAGVISIRPDPPREEKRVD